MAHASWALPLPLPLANGIAIGIAIAKPKPAKGKAKAKGKAMPMPMAMADNNNMPAYGHAYYYVRNNVVINMFFSFITLLRRSRGHGPESSAYSTMVDVVVSA